MFRYYVLNNAMNDRFQLERFFWEKNNEICFKNAVFSFTYLLFLRLDYIF